LPKSRHPALHRAYRQHIDLTENPVAQRAGAGREIDLAKLAKLGQIAATLGKG
jgi:hypothetical protein